MRDCRQLNSTSNPVQFFLSKSSDHVSPATGVVPFLFISKNGGSFSAAAGATTELSRGWYSWAGNETDRNTLGEIAVDVSGVNFDNIGFKLSIVPYDPFGSVNGLAIASGVPDYGGGNIIANQNTLLGRLTSARAGYLDNLNIGGLVQPSGASGGSLTAADVWSYSTRTINGPVAVSGNYDKSGYSLTQTFPANFSSLVISAAGLVSPIAVAVSGNYDKSGYLISGSKTTLDSLNDITAASVWAAGSRTLTGAVAVSGNYDKTGYVLNQSFPSNFASLAITGGGAVTIGTNNDKTGYSLSSAVAVSGNYDKTGYFISGTKSTLDVLNDISIANIYTQASGALQDFGLNKFNYLVQPSGSSYRFTQLALSLGPTGSGGSSGSSLTSDDVWTYATRTLSSGLDDVYFADIQFTRDQTNTKDEYTVGWYKNGTPVSTAVTTPTIQVIKRADATDLIPSTSMSTIINGVYKYDASGSYRITLGEAVVVQVAGTIDGSNRTWRKNITRDSE